MAVCRDHAKDACKRQQCKYYHIPVAIPPANIMADIHGTVTPNHTSATINTNPINNLTSTSKTSSERNYLSTDTTSIRINKSKIITTVAAEPLPPSSMTLNKKAAFASSTTTTTICG